VGILSDVRGGGTTVKSRKGGWGDGGRSERRGKKSRKHPERPGHVKRAPNLIGAGLGVGYSRGAESGGESGEKSTLPNKKWGPEDKRKLRKQPAPRGVVKKKLKRFSHWGKPGGNGQKTHGRSRSREQGNRGFIQATRGRITRQTSVLEWGVVQKEKDPDKDRGATKSQTRRIRTPGGEKKGGGGSGGFVCVRKATMAAPISRQPKA